ncbi:MAG: hypothetical protein WAW10_00940, partial [Gallionella sp.]
QAQSLSVSVATFKVDDKGGTALVRRETAPVARAPAHHAAPARPAPIHKGAAVAKAPAKAPAAKPKGKPQSDDDGEWEEF